MIRVLRIFDALVESAREVPVQSAKFLFSCLSGVVEGEGSGVSGVGKLLAARELLSQDAELTMTVIHIHHTLLTSPLLKLMNPRSILHMVQQLIQLKPGRWLMVESGHLSGGLQQKIVDA